MTVYYNVTKKCLIVKKKVLNFSSIFTFKNNFSLFEFNEKPFQYHFYIILLFFFKKRDNFIDLAIQSIET